MKPFRRGGDKGWDKEVEAGPWEKLVQLCLLVSESVCSAFRLSLSIYIYYLTGPCSFRVSTYPLKSSVFSIKKKGKGR